MNKALLVGINAYPNGNELNGCVNDVQDMAEFLKAACGFTSKDITLLTDASATADNIRAELATLMDGAATGDRLLFQYSGHGTTMPAHGKNVDAICPVDFDWTLPHALTALDFGQAFTGIPEGVEFNWLSDSCHSGDLTRTVIGPLARRIRTIPVPPDVQTALNAQLAGQAPSVVRMKSAAPLNGAFISGCTSAETSADAYIGGRYNGAFTYYLLEVLKANPAMSLTNVTSDVVTALHSNYFPQTPQIHGSPRITSEPLLYVPTVSARDIAYPRARYVPHRSPIERTHDLSGATVTLQFDKVKVADTSDLTGLLLALVPVVAETISEGRAVPESKDGSSWNVSGSAGPNGSWNIGGSVSTPAGGTTFTVGAQTGSGGTSGSIGVSGSF